MRNIDTYILEKLYISKESGKNNLLSYEDKIRDLIDELYFDNQPSLYYTISASKPKANKLKVSLKIKSKEHKNIGEWWTDVKREIDRSIRNNLDRVLKVAFNYYFSPAQRTYGQLVFLVRP